MDSKPEDQLVVIWTSGDREVALNTVFMYTKNSKVRGWWDDVTLVVWGPSSKLLSTDLELQQALREMIQAGVNVSACKACADNYRVADKLSQLGIDVKYMGEPLTDFLKTGRKVITF